MSKNNVLLRVDASTRDAFMKIKALNIPLTELVDQQGKLNTGFNKSRGAAAGMGGELQKAGKEAIGQLSKMAAGLMTIHTVAQLVTQELQTIRQIEGNFASQRGQMSNQFVAAQRVAVTGVTPTSLATEAVRRGADPQRFSAAFGAAASTSGAALNRTQLFDIAATVSQEFPDLTAIEDQRSMAGVIASLASASGDDPMSIAGKLQGFTRSVPAFDTSGATRSLQPLAQMLAVGDPQRLKDLGIKSPEALSAIMQRLATVQNRSRDEAGSQSTTAFISGNIQFLEKARGMGLLDADSTIMDVFRLQDDSTDPRVKALKEELLGGRNATSPDVLAMLDRAKAEGRSFTPEEEAMIARRAAAASGKIGKGVGGDLSVERKSELAIREMLSGDSAAFQEQMLRSVENIPTSSAAARAQFEAQQRLLRGDKVTSPAFFNLETEAANNSIALLAGGAEEAEMLNTVLKQLAEKAARIGGKSVTLAGFSREIDTYSRLLTEPTAFTPAQRSVNQDRIIVELRTIRDQLKKAGENQPFERKKELEVVASIFSNMADKLTQLFADGSDQSAVRQGALRAEEDRKDAFEQSLNSGLPIGVSEDKKRQAIKLRQRANRTAGDVLAPAASSEIAALFGDNEGERMAARIAQGFANASPLLSPEEAAQLARQSTAALQDSFTEEGILMPDSLSDRLGELSKNPKLQATFTRIHSKRIKAMTDRQVAARAPEGIHPGNFLIHNPLNILSPFLPNLRRGHSPGGTADLLPQFDPEGTARAEFNRSVQGAASTMFSKTDAEDVKRILSEIRDALMFDTPRTPVNRPQAAPQASPKPLNTRFAPVEADF